MDYNDTDSINPGGKPNEINLIRRMSHESPLTLVLLTVCAGMGALVVGEALLSTWVTASSAALIGSLLRLTIGAVFISFLIRRGLGSRAGVTCLTAANKPFWLIGFSPLCFFLFANLSGLNPSSWQLTTTILLAWFVENISVGFFEEVLFRGWALYILLQAWGATRRGLVTACIVQALLFGPLHLLNALGDEPIMLVLSNTVFATIVGIAFGAAYAYSRSLWTCVTIHTLINMAASANGVLGPNEPLAEKAFSLSTFLPSLVVVIVLSLLPSIWILYKVDLRSSHNDQETDELGKPAPSVSATPSTPKP